MGFSPSPLTSGLQAYIEEQNFPLIAKALTSSPTMALAEKQLNLKGKSAINLADISVTFQDGSGCAFNESGDITLTQRFIDPAKLKLNMEFCPKELEAVYLRTQLPAGAHQETIPFEEFFSNYLVEKIAAELEKMVWRGVNPTTKTSSLADGTGNFAFFNGFRDAILGASYINANTSAFGSGTPVGTPLTAATMLETVQRVYEAAADAVVESNDAVVFVGADKFRSLAIGISNGLGSFNTDAGQLQGYQTEMGSLSMIMPGTNLRIQATSGLSGINDVYLARTSNMFIGMDLDADASRIESWYSQDDRKFKIAAEMTVGTQVAFPDQISVVTV